MNATWVEWVAAESGAGTSFRWGYSDGEVVAEWEGILMLRATLDGELKVLQPAPGASEDRVEKTRRGAATAFLRARRNQHSLHASAVAFQGNALVCLGASGLGKSTMAELMCRHPGVELLADDTMGIELSSVGTAHVLPSESIVWLAADGSEDKTPVRSTHAARSAAALKWIVCLAFVDAARSIEVVSLRGADAVSALLPALIRFETKPALWLRELDCIDRLVSQARVVRAARARDASPETVADALLGLLLEETR